MKPLKDFDINFTTLFFLNLKANLQLTTSHSVESKFKIQEKNSKVKTLKEDGMINNTRTRAKTNSISKSNQQQTIDFETNCKSKSKHSKSKENEVSS